MSEPYGDAPRWQLMSVLWPKNLNEHRGGVCYVECFHVFHRVTEVSFCWGSWLFEATLMNEMRFVWRRTSNAKRHLELGCLKHMCRHSADGSCVISVASLYCLHNQIDSEWMARGSLWDPNKLGLTCQDLYGIQDLRETYRGTRSFFWRVFFLCII